MICLDLVINKAAVEPEFGHEKHDDTRELRESMCQQTEDQELLKLQEWRKTSKIQTDKKKQESKLLILKVIYLFCALVLFKNAALS